MDRHLKLAKSIGSAKDRGNSAFGSGNNEDACNAYEEALNMSECPKSVRSTLLSNRAAALLKLGRC